MGTALCRMHTLRAQEVSQGEGGAKIEHPPKVCNCLLKTAFEKGGFEKVSVLVGTGRNIHMQG